jgi:riboflavin-specific deaminase-like protein
MKRLMDIIEQNIDPEQLYERINFPDPPEDRPYIFINMVASVDGKTLLTDRGTTAKGLGSQTDQILMRRLQRNADAALIGSESLRIDPKLHYPEGVLRVTMTASGNLPLHTRFFTDDPGQAIVFAPRSVDKEKAAAIRKTARLHLCGDNKLDVRQMVSILRNQYEVKHLLCEGGSTVNGSLLAAKVVDELFLTVTPKISGGIERPTVVSGTGLAPKNIPLLNILSLYEDNNELYFRYHITGYQEG